MKAKLLFLASFSALSLCALAETPGFLEPAPALRAEAPAAPVEEPKTYQLNLTPESVTSEVQQWTGAVISILTILLAGYAVVKAKVHDAGLDQLFELAHQNREASELALLHAPPPASAPPSLVQTPAPETVKMTMQPPPAGAPQGLPPSSSALLCFLGFLLCYSSGCTTLESTAAKAEAEARAAVAKVQAWAATPRGAALLGAVQGAASVAALVDPALAPEAGGITLAIRSAESGSAPTQAALVSTISAITGSNNPAIASVASKVSAVVTTAQTLLDSGASPSAKSAAVNTAVELAAAVIH